MFCQFSLGFSSKKCQFLEILVTIHNLRFHSIRHSVQYDTSWWKNDLHFFFLTLKKTISTETSSFQTGDFADYFVKFQKVVSWVFYKYLPIKKSKTWSRCFTKKIENLNSKKKLLKQANKHGREGVVNEHGKKIFLF